jgi:molecular chaperone DnaK
MAGRLGIDFGTSNTVLALWDDNQKQGLSLHISEYGQLSKQGDQSVSLIPSLIHYTDDGRIWIGQQVFERELQESPRTLRWMKRYISNRSPMKIHLEGREITPYQAGHDFLTSVLIFTAQQIDFGEEEVALSVPVEAYEHYENWLLTIAESVGMPRFRLIDEPSAAALGYGANIQPGNVYLIFDFGGGTMHASLILIEEEARAATGRRCRVLGKAGRDIGGTTIDQWLFQEILRQNKRNDGDALIRPLSNSLLLQCQKIKELLTSGEHAALNLTHLNGIQLNADFTRSAFEDLLDQHNLYSEIQQVIRSTFNQAAERGYKQEDVKAALMVGGSSQIPSVQRVIRQIFGRERVMFDRPLDAVARGNAAFVAGVDFYDHIQHDYAIRFINPEKGRYDYRVVVKRGTPYPTEHPVARLAIKASNDQQEHLGLAIFEMGEARQPSSSIVELVFDFSGAARLSQVAIHELEQRSLFWMNENQPTFLEANPPGIQGEPRFEVEFSIDSNKRLVITARDLKTGTLQYQDHPVIKLI